MATPAIVQYGIGTFGSRATAVGGTAVLIAIQKLKEKAAKIAAHMMQCEASGVCIRSRKIFAASRGGCRRRDFRAGRAGG